jgi:hypothetical protein
VLRLGSVPEVRARLAEPLFQGFSGTGHLLLNTGIQDQQSQEPIEGERRDPHPNRLVWKWVESGPCAFSAGKRALRDLFWTAGIGSDRKFS